MKTQKKKVLSLKKEEILKLNQKQASKLFGGRILTTPGTTTGGSNCCLPPCW